MWLLSTEQLKLERFSSSEEVMRKKCPWAKRPGYAILSHVWAKDNSKEQSFADIEQLQREGVSSYDDPRVSAKVRGCVKTAREQGLGWVWDDTCCIDKRSSAELEEAINSMFRWYAEAAVCLAYLEDVPDDCIVHETNSAFRRSVWFTRGWTLQELLAPPLLLFFSTHWHCLGTKVGLARLLHDITGIDVDVLASRRALKRVSVARRMSWAAGRETSRVEDRAYALLGIFDVSMSTIYGEGAYAFRRLQAKIMKRNPDHTLFAWGAVWQQPCRGLAQANPGGRGPARGVAPSPTLRKSYSEPSPRPKHSVPLFTPPSLEHEKSLFARSPSDFRHAMTAMSVTEVIQQAGECINIIMPQTAPVYEHAITSSGVRCRFIVVPGRPFSLALLLCKDKDNRCLALPIWLQPGENHPERFVVGVSFADETYRLIPICRSAIDALHELGWVPSRMDAKPAPAPFSRGGPNGTFARAASRSSSMPTPSLTPTGTVQTIYIANAHPSFTPRCMLRGKKDARKLCIPAWLVSHRALYGLELEGSPALNEAVEAPSTLRVVQHAEESSPPKTEFTLHFGQCGGKLAAVVEFPRPENNAARPHPLSYAAVCAQGVPDPATDCSLPNPLGPHQHMDAWENGSRKFVSGEREVRLTATLTPPAFESYTLEIILEGARFDSLRAAQRARAPPPPPPSKTDVRSPTLLIPQVSNTPKSMFASLPSPPRTEDSSFGSSILSSLGLFQTSPKPPFRSSTPFSSASAKGSPKPGNREDVGGVRSTARRSTIFGS